MYMISWGGESRKGILKVRLIFFLSFEQKNATSWPFAPDFLFNGQGAKVERGREHKALSTHGGNVF